MIPLSDTKTSGKIPFLTIGLILINIVVFFIEFTTPDLEAFIGKYSLIPAFVDFGNPSTLVPFITSQFLHGDILHIASNMLFLWVFGDNIEERFKFLYVPFYLAGGIVAGLAQYFISPNSFIPTLGASGAVAAVLGAYLILYPRHQVKTLIPIFGFFTFANLSAPFLLLYWFGLQILSGFLSLGSLSQGGVAWFAHIGGFVFGMAVAYLFKGKESY